MKNQGSSLILDKNVLYLELVERLRDCVKSFTSKNFRRKTVKKYFVNKMATSNAMSLLVRGLLSRRAGAATGSAMARQQRSSALPTVSLFRPMSTESTEGETALETRRKKNYSKAKVS